MPLQRTGPCAQPALLPGLPPRSGAPLIRFFDASCTVLPRNGCAASATAPSARALCGVAAAAVCVVTAWRKRVMLGRWRPHVCSQAASSADVAVRRFMITVADASAAVAADTPEALAALLMQVGAVSVDFSCGSRGALRGVLGDAGGDAKAGRPTMQEARMLLEVSEGSVKDPAAARADFWRDLVLDTFWTGPSSAAAAASEASQQLFVTADGLVLAEVTTDDPDWIAAVRDCAPRLLGGVVVGHTLHNPADLEALASSQSRRPPILRLEVGPGFGFGDHPTTRLCATWLQGQDLAGVSLLDYGCGVGVLGLSACLLGATSAVGVDCDLASLLLARANASRNGLPMELFAAEDAKFTDWQCVSFYAPSEEQVGKAPFPKGPPKDKHFDAVVANMTRVLLSRLAPRIVSALAPGGRLALAGFREDDIPVVAGAFAAAGATVEKVGGEDGWVCLAGKAF